MSVPMEVATVMSNNTVWLLSLLFCAVCLVWAGGHVVRLHALGCTWGRDAQMATAQQEWRRLYTRRVEATLPDSAMDPAAVQGPYLGSIPLRVHRRFDFEHEGFEAMIYVGSCRNVLDYLVLNESRIRR